LPTPPYNGDAEPVPQRDLAIVDCPLAPVGVASGVGLTIDLASSDIQPPGEKDEAILYCSEHAQHFNDKPQIQAEQNQRAQLKSMKPDPVIHSQTSPAA
jgi:hypothetical protein